ncbi:MAG: thermopsin [Thermoplasmata archaeon]
MMIRVKRFKQISILLVIGIILFSMAVTSSFMIPNINQTYESKGSNHSLNPVTSTQKDRTSFSVNPFELYSKEPAPIGVADFGIGPGNKPYEYSTNSFMGNIYVKSLYAYNNSINQSQAWASFQLNVNLVFKNGNTSYVYWIQNVAEVNTSDNYVGFVDNIWNFSSPSSSMNNSSVSGYGTVTSSGNSSYYYSIANQSLTGNGINLSAPYNIKLAVNTGVGSNGKPYVAFLYNDGYGWVLYDNVSFIFAKRLYVKPAFLVDGYNYEPTGYTFYDGELIIGGPGNGTNTFDLRSAVFINLLFWNGHNYQDVPNAYNFGSNTAETVSNAISGFYYTPSNGSIFSEIKNGSGNLGALYYQTQLSTVNITLPLSSGFLIVNGSRYNFVDHGINITLYPSSVNNKNGYYNFILENYNGTVEWEDNISLYAGEHLSIRLNLFMVEFIESGIPTGLQWYIHLSNGINITTYSNNISLYLPNGSYSYSVYLENERSSISQGSFSIQGKNVTIYLTINLEKYSVNIQENGLPTGMEWSINLNSFNYNSTNSSILLLLPNGIYNFTVAPIQGFRSDITEGIFNVNNSYLSIMINWTIVDYNITVDVRGLQNGTGWYITINGSFFYGKDLNRTFYSNSSSITIGIPNGSYIYTIQISNGFIASPKAGIIIINGSNYYLSTTAIRNVNFSGYSLNSIPENIIILIGVIIIIAGTGIAYILRKK